MLSAACVVLSARHLSRVRALGHGDTNDLANKLKRVPLDARLVELAKRAPKTGFAREMAEVLEGATDESARVAAANEAIDEAAHALDVFARWPAAAARLAAFGGLLFAIVSFIATRDLAASLTIVVVGAAGALASLEVGRRAKNIAHDQRAAIDNLVRTVLGPLADEPAPKRRRLRTSRREGG